LFKPNDSDSLAQKINYFVEYIYTRKIIMEQGNNTYNKYFDYNEMIQAYEKLFDIVCKK
jgi:glycosyltransferase involved in cell wall biosynthesis